MKKLVFACCAVLVVGGCMMLGGWAAGGRLYGSYANGRLMPVSATLHDIGHFAQDKLHYRVWDDDYGWHNGWFFDDFDDRVEDSVEHALDEFAPFWRHWD